MAEAEAEQIEDPSPGAPIERFITRFRYALAGLLALVAAGIVYYNLANRPADQPVDLSAPSNVVVSMRTQIISTDASDAVTVLRWTVTGSGTRTWLAAYDGDDRQRFAVGGPADGSLTLEATLTDDRTGKVLARAQAAKSPIAEASFTSECDAVAGISITCIPVWGDDATWTIEIAGSVSPSETAPLD